VSMDAKTTRLGGADLSMARPLAVAAILIVALAIQTTLLTRVTILGVIPQLLFVVMGVVVGFVGGLLQDLLLPESIMGLTALVYTMVGYGVGTIRSYLPSQSVWTPVITVAFASAMAEASYAILAIMMGERWVSIADTAKISGLVVLYNTLLTPFVFPVVKRVADRVRPERVVRF
jgi:rod shape-determining protein MreD